MKRKHFKKEDYLKSFDIVGIKYEKNRINDDNIKIICPFHQEKTPSCSINLTKEFFHCFGCGKHGTLVGLIYDKSNKTIESLLGIKSEYKESVSDKELNSLNFEKLNKQIRYKGDIFSVQSNKVAYDHLKNDREITEDTINKFNISYSEKVLINKTTFFKRILIPIVYEDKTVNMEGRKLPFSKQEPKVLYPNNTIKPLFNFNNLEKYNYKNPEIRANPLWIMEGLMDCLKFYSWFNKNVTCTFGNNLSDIQVKLITDNFKDVIIVPDNDVAGENLINELLQIPCINLKICLLPEKFKDIGDCSLFLIERSIKNVISSDEWVFNKFAFFS